MIYMLRDKWAETCETQSGFYLQAETEPAQRSKSDLVQLLRGRFCRSSGWKPFLFRLPEPPASLPPSLASNKTSFTWRLEVQTLTAATVKSCEVCLEQGGTHWALFQSLTGPGFTSQVSPHCTTLTTDERQRQSHGDPSDVASLHKARF